MDTVQQWCSQCEEWTFQKNKEGVESLLLAKPKGKMVDKCVDWVFDMITTNAHTYENWLPIVLPHIKLDSYKVERCFFIFMQEDYWADIKQHAPQSYTDFISRLSQEIHQYSPMKQIYFKEMLAFDARQNQKELDQSTGPILQSRSKPRL